MRYVPNGTPVTNSSVAVNRRWNNAAGSQGEETLWFRCTAWRKTVDIVLKATRDLVTQIKLAVADASNILPQSLHLK